MANGVPYSKCKNSGGDWHPGLGVDPKYNYTRNPKEVGTLQICDVLHHAFAG